MRITKVLRVVLTPDQYKKYQDLQRAHPSDMRSGTVWSYDADGLVPHQVKLGLSDANRTEVVNGIEPGARVVLRAREIVQ